MLVCQFRHFPTKLVVCPGEPRDPADRRLSLASHLQIFASTQPQSSVVEAEARRHRQVWPGSTWLPGMNSIDNADSSLTSRRIIA